MTAPCVSRQFAEAVFDYLAELGVPARAVLREAGLDAPRLLPPGQVPLAIYERLFEAGERLTGDGSFGAHMGARPFPRSWGLVTHLAATAPDAMTAVSALMEYSELQLNFLRIQLRESAQGRVFMELRHDRVPVLNRHVVEHLVTNIAVLAGTQVGYELPRLRIELAHPESASAAFLAELFGSEVIFGADAYRFEVAADFFEQEGLFGEADLYQVTEQLARERLMQLRGEDRFLNKVRETVLRQLPAGLPKVDDIAGSLDMSGRSLQRRLQERNLRYQQVLDEVRSELAVQLIGDGGLSLNEVADYLGFNDQSALQHAFRRWQGMTPGQYRRLQGGAVGS